MSGNKIKTNPNGANQHILDPRQKLCWELYIDPKSEYFGNAYQAAQKAGYEESTASQITTEKWFLDKLRRLQMLVKAEKVLDKTLDGKDLRLAQDTAKFVAKTLGKNEGYSERTEHTGADGKDLFAPSEEEREKADRALKAIE